MTLPQILTVVLTVSLAAGLFADFIRDNRRAGDDDGKYHWVGFFLLILLSVLAWCIVYERYLK